MAYVDIELEEFEDDELIDELEERGYYVYNEEQEDADTVYEKFNKDNYIIGTNYDGKELREHLIDILQCGHHVNDYELLALINDRLQR